MRSLRSGIAEGGGLAVTTSRSLPFPAPSVPENSAVISSDFFLRPAHARFRRLPALDVVLGAGESGGGLTGAAGRAWLWPWPMLAREAERGGAKVDERMRGKKRGLEDEESEETERSEVMISDWLELDSGAAGRRSEDAREEAREEESELEEREVGTLLERAWVSVVRGCDEGMLGVLVDLGRE